VRRAPRLVEAFDFEEELRRREEERLVVDLAAIAFPFHSG